MAIAEKTSDAEWTEADGRALHARLRVAGVKVAAAESLTVGRLQAELGRYSGASGYFAGGVTCYTAASKVRMLRVDPIHAEEVNSVSARVAEEMARGAARLFEARIALATTGYAEPDPGRGVHEPFAWVAATVDGPQGGVMTALIDGAGLDREAMQVRAAGAALSLLAALLEAPKPRRQGLARKPC